MVDLDLTFFRHRRDNRVRLWDQHVVGPEAFTELLAQHGASDRKDITMVVPARFKTCWHTDGYEPAPKNILHRDHDGNLVLDANGEPVVLGVEYPVDPSTGRHYVQRSGK